MTTSMENLIGVAQVVLTQAHREACVMGTLAGMKHLHLYLMLHGDLNTANLMVGDMLRRSACYRSRTACPRGPHAQCTCMPS